MFSHSRVKLLNNCATIAFQTIEGQDMLIDLSLFQTHTLCESVNEIDMIAILR